jgi:hypothetical protein
MRFGVQRQQTLLVTTELVIWRYANAIIFTNQSELDFGIAHVFEFWPEDSSISTQLALTDEGLA